MEWRDEGVVLTLRRHGETAAIIEAFTPGHGRHAGVVRGGSSRRIAPTLQPGSQLDLTWRARLEDHIGTFTTEPIRSRAATLMSDRAALAGLNAVTSLLSFSLPEREPHKDLYRRSIALLDMIGDSDHWPIAYVRWERALLDDLGFGLDLARCATSGATEDLIFVSPRTGRAVSRDGAGDWADRLLPLSPTLVGRGEGSPKDISDALRTTGHFLETWLAPSLGDKPIPEARLRLPGILKRHFS